MSSASHLRTRIRSVSNIKQIATSMEMVASARLRKAQIKARQSQYYIAKTEEILSHLDSLSSELKNPLMTLRPVKKIGLIIVASDRGLCGSYNTSLFSKADQFMTEHTLPQVELFLLGRKAIQNYKHKGWPLQGKLADWSGKMRPEHIKELNSQIIALFLTKEWDEIWVIYTQFHDLMHRQIVIEKFLPLSKKPMNNTQMASNYIFEPNLKTIFNHLVERYLLTKLRSILDQSHASELASRIFSMKAAATNADEMLQELNLEKNKTRQAAITREILETLGV